MRRNCFFKFVLLLLLVATILPVAADADDVAPAGDLIVVIKGVQVDQAGQLIVSLYQGENAWLEQGEEYLKRVVSISEGDETSIVFSGLPQNQEFALQVVHDRNSNGELDFQWFPPKPEEGVGVSNNTFRIGPPDYEAATFRLSGEAKTLLIDMRY